MRRILYCRNYKLILLATLQIILINMAECFNILMWLEYFNVDEFISMDVITFKQTEYLNELATPTYSNDFSHIL